MSTTKKKILFIEDETELAILMRGRIEFWGYQMIFACDGEEGLKIIELEKPDLILMDKIMPKMNGLEVCQKIKANPRTSHIPVIIISGSAERDLLKQCRAVGAANLVVKPYESQELLAKIEAALNQLSTKEFSDA